MGIEVTHQTALFVIAALVSYHEARKNKREIERNKSQSLEIDIRPSGSGQSIPILYGRCGVNAPLVFAGVGRRFQTHSLPAQIGNLTDRLASARQLLFTQSVLSLGEIESLYQVVMDNDVTPGTDINNAMAHRVWYNSASEWGGDFRDDNSTATFSGLSYVSSVYYRNNAEPVFAGQPQTFFGVKGKKIKNFLRAADGSVSLSSPVYLRSMPAILFDYLTSDTYGPGFSESDFDLVSFDAAAQIAGTTVESDYWLSETGAQASLQRYEYNGAVPSTRDFPSALARILSVAPGAAFFRAVDSGKYKLKLPDSATPESQQSLITFGPDDLTDRVEVQYPDSQSKLNRVTGSFANAAKSFVQDSITYPSAGSTVDQQLQREDGNILLTTDIDLSGANNARQAGAICYSQLQLSRRPVFDFTVFAKGLLYEPGDIVRLLDDDSGIDAYVRILETRVNSNLTVRMKGIEFVRTDYAWTPGDTLQIPTATVISRDLEIPRIAQVIYSEHAREIQCQVFETMSAPVYEWQYRFGASSVWIGWLQTTSRIVRFPVSMSGGDYVFRVRTVFGNRRSAWSQSAGSGSVPALTSLSATDGAGREDIFAVTSNNASPSLPSNNWGYDSPVLPWTDGQVALNPGQTLWRAYRKIIGQPTAGTQIDDVWSVPVVVGHYGVDGVSGVDGSEGVGVEYVFAASDSDTNPPSGLDHSWPYDEPVSPWFDGGIPLNAGQFLWRAERPVPGVPNRGDVLPAWASWRNLQIVGRHGRDGSQGLSPVAISSDTMPLYVSGPFASDTDASVSSSSPQVTVTGGSLTSPASIRHRVVYRFSTDNSDTEFVHTTGLQTGIGVWSVSGIQTYPNNTHYSYILSYSLGAGQGVLAQLRVTWIRIIPTPPGGG